MNIRKLPEEERPREKLLRTGKENLSTAEILAILLRSGTKEKIGAGAGVGADDGQRGGNRISGGVQTGGTGEDPRDRSGESL